MNKFFLYLLGVILGTIMLDLMYRPLCQWTYNNPIPKSSILEGTNKFAYVTKRNDIVILGASRAERHYAAKTIEDSLHVSAYNYGGAGCDIIQQYLSLLTCVKSGSPKMVILDLSSPQLSKEWINDKNSRYYPFYFENDTVKAVVDDIGGFKMKFLMMSSFIQYNSKFSYVLLRLLRQKSTNVDIEGFRPLPYTGTPAKCRNNDRKVESVNKMKYYPPAIRYFEKIVSTCDKEKINLVICYSPSLKRDEFEISGIKKMCEQYNLMFWDYSNAIIDPILFKDENHLNEKGAIRFTDLIIGRLRHDYPSIF